MPSRGAVEIRGHAVSDDTFETAYRVRAGLVALRCGENLVMQKATDPKALRLQWLTSYLGALLLLLIGWIHGVLRRQRGERAPDGS